MLYVSGVSGEKTSAAGEDVEAMGDKHIEYHPLGFVRVCVSVVPRIVFTSKVVVT